jgi:hypothetical protein
VLIAIRIKNGVRVNIQWFTSKPLYIYSDPEISLTLRYPDPEISFQVERGLSEPKASSAALKK